MTVSRVARRAPASIAVAFDGIYLTYGAVDQRANGLATHLQNLGVGPDIVAAVCLDRSPELVVAILAVLKAGGAYLPLDPSYPRERLDYMLRDADVQVVVTSRSHAAHLADRKKTIVCVDESGVISGLEAPPKTSVGLDHLAYLIYTSGSTGEPKGVMVSHRNLAYSTAARLAYYGTPVDRYLLLSSVAFDSSVAGLFWTLCSGGRIVWPSPGAGRDPGRLVETVDVEQVTHLLALPSLYRMMLQRRRVGSLASLRTVIVAGEACPTSLAVEHGRALPSAALYNEYGPTEATVWCTVHEVGKEPHRERVPIGKPIPEATIYIVRPDGLLCADDEAGELYVGGPGVTRGYLNKPELTADRFVADVFSEVPGARLYRTGDLARCDSRGIVDFLGRLDHQVKIRGYRIELDEIESRLTEHPSVAEAAVTAREDESGERRLVAHLLLCAGKLAGVNELRAFVAERLPEFMVPAAFVVLPAFPRSANGKVDRAALPGVGRARPELQQAYAPPRDALERWLAGIWEQELMLDRVGIDDRFFELGGDSIRAARIASQIQDRLGEFFFVVVMFETPTVAGLAGSLRQRYRAAVTREFGDADRPLGTPDEPGVDAALIERARSLVSSPRRLPSRITASNPQALFILSPPRSGTTLLTAMLAGHPRVFAASELNLLGFDTLGERKAAYSGPMSLWREGAIRCLMEAEGLTADAAAAEMNNAEAADLPVRDLFDRLQRAVAPRMLLDKSPAYALDPATLRRIEKTFDRPLYVHLSRHPQAAIRSFADNHMDQVYFPHRGFTARQAGEAVWGMTHENVLTFLARVPEDRQVHLHYERLVAHPEEVMKQLCAALSLEFHPDLLEPYKDKDRKILSGLHPESKSMGDPKFHTLDRIVNERSVVLSGIDLGRPTIATAAKLGYAPSAQDSTGRISTFASRPAALAEQTRGALGELMRRRRQAQLTQPRDLKGSD